MSQYLNPKRISDAWLEAFDWFEAHPTETFTIEAGNLKKARSLRIEFYRVRHMLQNDPELRALYANLDRREVSIEGTTVLFKYKEATELSKLLQQALVDNNTRVEGDNKGSEVHHD